MTQKEIDKLRTKVWEVLRQECWTVRYLSGKSNVNYLTLRRWLNGSHDTSTEKLSRIFDACSLQVEQIERSEPDAVTEETSAGCLHESN